MQSHPIPQNIASYEFKLVGDMTLKQFMFLAIGGLLGLAVWKLPIPFAIFRFMLAIVPVAGGILAAFVPLNGRPFTDWVGAFFKAIYAPTQYDYEEPVVKVIVEQTVKPVTQKAPAISFARHSASNPTPSVPAPENVAPPSPVIPKATPKIEVIRPSIGPTQTTTSTYAPPPAVAVSTPPEIVVPKETVLSNLSDVPTPIEKPTATPRFIPIDSQNEVKITTSSPPLTHIPVSNIPSASTTSSLAPPKQPNILTGLVVDPNQVSLPGATVEIVDSQTGIPTRALRTNQLGQFQIAIPLPPGQYALNVEKTGYKFAPVSVTVDNNIIKPVLIIASAVDSPSETAPVIPNQVTKF